MIDESAARPISKWLDALAMIVAAPALAHFAAGLFHGFASPSNPMLLALLAATWVGVALIPLVVALIVLVFARRFIAWTVLLVLLAGLLFACGTFTARPPVTEGLNHGQEAHRVQHHALPCRLPAKHLSSLSRSKLARESRIGHRPRIHCGH